MSTILLLIYSRRLKRQMNKLSFSFISGDRDTCYHYVLISLFDIIGKIEVVAWIFHLCLFVIGVFFFSIGAKRLLGFVPSLITAVGTGIGDNANQSNGKSLGSTKKRNGLWV